MRQFCRRCYLQVSAGGNNRNALQLPSVAATRTSLHLYTRGPQHEIGVATVQHWPCYLHHLCSDFADCLLCWLCLSCYEWVRKSSSHKNNSSYFKHDYNQTVLLKEAGTYRGCERIEHVWGLEEYHARPLHPLKKSRKRASQPHVFQMKLVNNYNLEDQLENCKKKFFWFLTKYCSLHKGSIFFFFPPLKQLGHFLPQYVMSCMSIWAVKYNSFVAMRECIWTLTFAIIS